VRSLVPGLLLVVVSVVGGAAADSPGPPPPECWLEPRAFFLDAPAAAAVLKAADERLRIERALMPIPEPFSASPGGVYAYHLSGATPDGREAPGPRATLVVFAERPHVIRIEARDVAALRDPRWVNDKLLYFRLVLGRLNFVDVIYDVERERVVHREAGAFGDTLFQQARASCATPEVRPSCAQACDRLPHRR
jgi:hypothetical protein